MQGNVRVQSTFLQDGSTLRHKQGLHPCAIIYARPPKAETPSLNQQVFELLAFHPWGGGGARGTNLCATSLARALARVDLLPLPALLLQWPRKCYIETSDVVSAVVLLVLLVCSCCC